MNCIAGQYLEAVSSGEWLSRGGISRNGRAGSHGNAKAVITTMLAHFQSLI